MPSVGTYKAQPVTRTFVVTQDESNDEYGAYYFYQTDVDDWYTSNSSKLTKVGNGLYVVKNSENFSTVVRSLDNSGSFERKRSLIDMGKEIVIGNETNSRLVVLRKVQEAYPPADGGDGITAYIVVESNYRSANGATPSNSIMNVNVARA